MSRRQKIADEDDRQEARGDEDPVGGDLDPHQVAGGPEHDEDRRAAAKFQSAEGARNDRDRERDRDASASRQIATRVGLVFMRQWAV